MGLFDEVLEQYLGEIVCQVRLKVEVVRACSFPIYPFLLTHYVHLERGDTHLNNEGDESPSLKVDLRVLDDEVVQRYSQETEVAVAKFAKSSPGCAKFTSDRSKLQIEAKVVIDNHIRNDTNITSVDSLQICGLEVFITNSKLEAPGLYVGNEIYHLQIDASLSRFGEYLGLIAHLLCFMVCWQCDILIH